MTPNKQRKEIKEKIDSVGSDLDGLTLLEATEYLLKTNAFYRQMKNPDGSFKYFEVTLMWEYYGENTELLVMGHRFETDDEINKRLEYDKLREVNERKMLAELKAKYE